MTGITVQLLGPDKRNVPVIVQLIGPPSTNTANSTDGELLSTVAKQRTDTNGYLLLELTPNDELFPDDTFYRVTAKATSGISRWNISLTADNAPEGPYPVGATALQVLSPTPRIGCRSRPRSTPTPSVRSSIPTSSTTRST